MRASVAPADSERLAELLALDFGQRTADGEHGVDLAQVETGVARRLGELLDLVGGDGDRGRPRRVERGQRTHDVAALAARVDRAHAYAVRHVEDAPEIERRPERDQVEQPVLAVDPRQRRQAGHPHARTDRGRRACTRSGSGRRGRTPGAGGSAARPPRSRAAGRPPRRGAAPPRRAGASLRSLNRRTPSAVPCRMSPRAPSGLRTGSRTSARVAVGILLSSSRPLKLRASSPTACSRARAVGTCASCICSRLWRSNVVLRAPVILRRRPGPRGEPRRLFYGRAAGALAAWEWLPREAPTTIPSPVDDTAPSSPELILTGERTLPGIPEENYWFQRHVVAYRDAAERVAGMDVLDAGCGEGYGASILASRAA